MDSVFIGLDLSLSGTGMTRLCGNAHEMRTIKTKPDKFKVILERMVYIRNQISDFVFADGTMPCMVCVEDIFMPPKMASSNSSLKLAMLGGIVRVMLYETHVPFCLITPMQLKKFVTGKGVGEKGMILREVFRRWKVEAADDNQADSAGLAHCARAIFATKMIQNDTKLLCGQSEDGLTKPQSDTVVKIMKERPFYNF